MASPEKMLKMLIDEIHQIQSPLASIIKNQEILIIQNKQAIELLEEIRSSRNEDEQ